MKKIDVIILAGGAGCRIKKFSKNKIPKSLLKIKNKHFLDYLLKNISYYPINKIYIISGFLGDHIKKKYHKKIINHAQIHCIVEKKIKGTGYALYSIKQKIKNDFILINGDTLIDFDFNIFFNLELNKNYIGCMILSKNFQSSLSSKLTNLNINKNKEVLFSKKILYVNTGHIFFKKEIVDFLSKKKLSLENDIINKLILKNKILGLISNSFFIDIGTPKNYILAKKLIPKYFKFF